MVDCLFSIWLDHNKIASALIRAGAKVNVRDKDGWTPLFFTAAKGFKRFGSYKKPSLPISFIIFILM